MTVDRHLNPEHTPDHLNSGIRRVNKLPLVIVFGLVAVFILCIVFVLQKRTQKQETKPAEMSASIVETDATLSRLIQDQPDGLIEPPKPKKKTEGIENTYGSGNSLGEGLEEKTDTEKDIQKMKLKLLKEALYSETKTKQSQSQSYQSPMPFQYSMPNLENPMANALANFNPAMLHDDPNKQARKDEFMNQQKSTMALQHTLKAPKSPFEIKAGTVIPATMISGINSDLPGQIIAQVSQPVFDTAEGRHVLIPQGSKLVGFYDSHVAYGQKRVLVAWNRIVFPDASTLELEGMPGSDQAGYGGFQDKVNTHFWKIFGNTFLLSVMSAGFQMSQPDNANPMSPQAQLAASMGQQFSQLGMEMARKNMDIQPTLEISPGYRFNVMVNKDISFDHPYK